MKKIIITLTLCATLMLAANALAETSATASNGAAQATVDEQVSASSLDASEPTLLPNSFFYFIKDWARGLRQTFTFSASKKVELINQYSNEKLLELQKLIADNASEEDIQKAIDNYREEIQKLKDALQQVKDTAEKNADVDKFLDKYTEQQILQEKILQKLQDQVPSEIYEKIKAAREEHLQRFGEVMQKLETRQQEIRSRIMEAVNKEAGSNLKDIKDAIILQSMADQTSGAVRSAIESVRQTELTTLRNKLQAMDAEQRQAISDYVKDLSGEKETIAQTMEDIKSTVQSNLDLQNEILKAKNEMLQERANELEQEANDLQENIRDNINEQLQNMLP